MLTPEFLAILTRGHTKGHCVLLFRNRFLFTGDLNEESMARLRKALGPAGELVVTRSPGYLLVSDESSIDAFQFEARFRAARARTLQDPRAAITLLDDALALWRGPAYGEFSEGFARPAATRLEELRLSALEVQPAAVDG